jgi:hypothetical protein
MSLIQTQIIREYEKEIGANRGDIANNPARLADFVAEENIAFDDYLTLAFNSESRWQFDDSNHADFPEIVTDLVAGQRAYLFGVDQTGNIVLDVYRVYVKVNGEYTLINPIDKHYDDVDPSNYNGTDKQGVPYEYDKLGNAVLLNLVPQDSIVGGLKVLINREASYFTTSDTTKKPGVPGLHHKWFYLKPALDYARRHTLDSYNRLEAEVDKLEKQIKHTFAMRARDEQNILTAQIIDSL